MINRTHIPTNIRYFYQPWWEDHRCVPSTTGNAVNHITQEELNRRKYEEIHQRISWLTEKQRRKLLYRIYLNYSQEFALIINNVKKREK